MRSSLKQFGIKLLLPIILISVGYRVGAQYYSDDDNRKFYGGLLLGTNLSQVDGDISAGYKKRGLNTGGIVYLKMDEHAAFSLEILYSQKGARQKDREYLLKLNYAEIPVMFNYFDKHKSNLGVGLSYSRLANSSESRLFGIPGNPDPADYPFKKSDINLLLGGNLHVWKGFFLNLRFQYSLFSIRSNIPSGYGNGSGRQVNNVVALRVMYLFM